MTEENVNNTNDNQEDNQEPVTDDTELVVPADEDNVVDCCCDSRTLIDNGNWAIKLPRRSMTVKESIQFCDVLIDILGYMPHFGYNYEGWYDMLDSIRDYRMNALQILDEKDCVSITGDVNCDGDKI